MFIHQAGPQALVQYTNLYDCIHAKSELEKMTFMTKGRRYSFEVQYSKLRELVIHKTNNYSRDFLLFPLEAESYRLGFDLLRSPEDFDASLSAGSETDSLSSSSAHPVCQDHSCLLGGKGLFNQFPEEFNHSNFAQDAELRGLNWSPFSISDRPQDSFQNPLQSPIQHPLHDPLPNPLQRRSSDVSSFSSGSVLHDLSIGESLWNTHYDGFCAPSLCPQHLHCIRRYVLEGFATQIPISDLVDYLYGIDIKYAEYKAEFSGYSVIVFGISEWSDAMLTNYLNSNPVDGRVIHLQGPSQPVEYH